MPRTLAVDFGERRIGLATCDATGQVVAARRTLSRKSDDAAAREIAAFCLEEEIEAVVLGIPRSPDGQESPFARRIRSFARKLSRLVPVPVAFHEETLTSWEARQRAGPAAAKEDVDREAAAVLLADYLAHASREIR